MEKLIETNTSYLSTYSFPVETLISQCLEEIEGKLLVNPPITVFGRPAIQHRSIGFFSNTSIGYKYSGQLAESIPLTPALEILLGKVNSFMKADFNGILVNKYGDGNDYIGDHSDDENNLDPIGVVSISYGAVRKFRIRDKVTRKIVMDIPTASDQLLHMGGDFQKEFTHGIPIEKKVREIRYSFTFRKHNK